MLAANVLCAAAVYGLLSVAYVKGLRFPYFLHAVKMFPFFYCGALFGMSGGVRRLFTSCGWAYALSLAAYFALVLTGTRTSVISLTGLPAIVVLMTLFGRYDWKIPAAIGTVGRYSLEIYVFHWFLLPSLPWVAPLLSQDMGTQIFNGNIVLMFVMTSVAAGAIVAACMAIGCAVRQSGALAAALLGMPPGRKAGEGERNNAAGE